VFPSLIVKLDPTVVNLVKIPMIICF
jgi:hypothetical protein